MTEDIQVKREIVLEADAETLQRMRKESALAATIPRRLRWLTSASRWLFDC
jgi:hypothetical protein